MTRLSDVLVKNDNYAIVSTSRTPDSPLVMRRRSDGRLFAGQFLPVLDVLDVLTNPRGLEDDGDNNNSNNAWVDDLLGVGYLGAGGCEKDMLCSSLWRLLWHDNLVSIHAITAVQAPYRTIVEPILVWDLCDAGTLDSVLDRMSALAGKDDRSATTAFLPESLCWHVARSMLQALAWLHDGQRFVPATRRGSQPWQPDRKVSARTHTDGEPVVASSESDWMPVLHQAMRPENIFFQHPRGRETYGSCKLGNFSQCFVSGHMDELTERQSMAVPPPGHITALGSKPGQYGPDLADVGDVLTRGTDLGGLGEVLYEMMTGRPWMTPAEKEDRRRRHLKLLKLSKMPETVLPEDGSAYTASLTGLVRDLLAYQMPRQKPSKAGTAASLRRRAETGFQTWRVQTSDGRLYVDASECV